ncbi:MAG: hypothetical protein JRH20_15795 [Deltaproteobacteria bacterium]|nr:hypothetical protein [Deltaproteobacteria bacterium]
MKRLQLACCTALALALVGPSVYAAKGKMLQVRPQSALGRKLCRQAKHLRQPLAGADKLLKAADKVLSGKKRVSESVAFSVNSMINDAITFSKGKLKPVQKKKAQRLLNQVHEVLLNAAGSGGYPGETFYNAKVVLEQTYIRATPKHRQRARTIAANALNEELGDFIGRHSQAAFADDRAKGGKAITELATKPLNSADETDNKAVLAATAKARKKALNYVKSDGFKQFIARGAPRNVWPIDVAKAPKNFAELQNALSLRVQHVSEIRTIEQLLKRVPAQRISPEGRQRLTSVINTMARRIAKVVDEEVGFRAQYIDSPADASYWMQNVHLKTMASVKRLSRRLASFGASREAMRNLEFAQKALNGLITLEDSGRAADKLYKRAAKKAIED